MSWLRSVLLIYGVLNILGGIIGFVVGKSIWSAVVGVPAGILILWLTMQTTTKPAMAYRSLGVVSVLLAGFWVFRLIEVSSQGKSPMMAILNLALSLGVFASLGYAHMASTRKPSA